MVYDFSMCINSVQVSTSSSELCPHPFVLQKTTRAKTTTLNYTICVFFFFWWIWWKTSCYWRKQRRCRTHSLESFHGIHRCCQEYHYLWYNIKGPSESMNVFESFLMEDNKIIPVGKMHTCISFITSGCFLTFFVWFFFCFSFLNPNHFWYLTCRYHLNWNTIQMHCLHILVHISVAKMI